MFTIRSFSPVGAQATEAPSIFTYTTTDTFAQVLAVGYFTGVSFNEGDTIRLTCADGDRIVKYESGVFINDSPMIYRVIVTRSEQFENIDSGKEYFIDGIIDMTGVSIEIPAGGIDVYD